MLTPIGMRITPPATMSTQSVMRRVRHPRRKPESRSVTARREVPRADGIAEAYHNPQA